MMIIIKIITNINTVPTDPSLDLCDKCLLKLVIYNKAPYFNHYILIFTYFCAIICIDLP